MTQGVVQPEPAQREHRHRGLNRDDAKVERRQPDDGEQPVKLASQRRHRHDARAQRALEQ